MSDLNRLKTRVTEAVDRMAEDLWSLALRIHANPELAFKEEKAAAWLTELLERRSTRTFARRPMGSRATRGSSRSTTRRRSRGRAWWRVRRRWP